jgi:hypothetical protein
MAPKKTASKSSKKSPIKSSTSSRPRRTQARTGAGTRLDTIDALKGAFGGVLKSLEKQRDDVQKKLSDLSLNKKDLEKLLSTVSKNSERALNEAKSAVEKSKKILADRVAHQSLSEWAKTLERARGEIEALVAKKLKK